MTLQASHHAQRVAFAQARQERKARHRDIAAQLQISEGELLAAHVGGFKPGESPLQATRLRAEWPAIIGAIEPLGEVMALTRNESAVHEKVGIYSHVSGTGIGLVLGGAIDLRVFYMQWAHGFAVQEQLSDGALQQSLQFFDAAGTAIHKIFMKPQSDLAAYEALMAKFSDADQQPGISVEPAKPEPEEKPDSEIDVAAFHAGWAALRDTHEFFGLLRKSGVTRTQAFRLAEPRFVQALPVSSAHEVISRAAQEGVSIMVFVGNPGMIQIHSGPVHKVAVMGPWLNIFDAGFNLHLREDHIASAFLVRKPTVDGLVCSLELFDAKGMQIATLFGERKPGQAERCDWRTLLESMADGVPAC